MTDVTTVSSSEELPGLGSPTREQLQRESSVKNLINMYSKVQPPGSKPVAIPSKGEIRHHYMTVGGRIGTSKQTAKALQDEMKIMAAEKREEAQAHVEQHEGEPHVEEEQPKQTKKEKTIETVDLTTPPRSPHTKKKSRTFSESHKTKVDKEVQTDPIEEEDEDEEVYPNIALTVEVPSLKDSLANMILCIVNSGITVKELIHSIARTLAAFLDVTKVDDFYLTLVPSAQTHTASPPLSPSTSLTNFNEQPTPKKLDPDAKLCDSNVKDRDVLIFKGKKESNITTSKSIDLPSNPASKNVTPASTPRLRKSLSEETLEVDQLRAAIAKEEKKRERRQTVVGSSPTKGLLPSSSPVKGSSGTRKRNANAKSQIVTAAVPDAVMEGFLMKKNKNRRWKRRWLALDEEYLYCFKNQSDPNPSLKIPLFCASVKTVQHSDHKKFELITAEQTYEFYAETDKELLQWTALLEDICQSIVHRSIGASSPTRPTRNDSISNGQPINQNPSFHEDIKSSEKKELQEIMKLPGNTVCADCDCPNPEWASVNLGVFICINCSGAHRNLGTHISKVRSCTLDDWDAEMVQFMKTHGNEKSNAYWEFAIPKGVKKPSAKDGLTERQNFIHAKYERKEFIQKKADQGMIFLCWENDTKWFGFVEIETQAPLSTLRAMITDVGIEIKSPYNFLFRKAPLTQIQEQKKTVFDCMIQMEGNPSIVLRKAQANE